MAGKKIEPITNLGKESKLVVQKSLPLFALWRSDLTLSEFKILDTYLARIDSHQPNKRAIIFEKGELEEKLGVKRITRQQLEERLKHLMGNVVKIPDENEKKGFRLITLFEEAVAEQDEYGLWQVKLECTQKAMRYIFNIENLGYLRYKLRCITSITSRYTYIMFIYLEANRFRKTWEISIDELKEILNCSKEEIYKEYKFFNQKILKRVQKEMHEKTECKYTYEPIKKGRTVVSIRFTVETLSSANLEKSEDDPNQMTMQEWFEANDVDMYEHIEVPIEKGKWQGVADNLVEIYEAIDMILIRNGIEFDTSEIERVYNQLCLSFTYSDTDEKLDELGSAILKMRSYNSKNPIRNKCSYLLKILKNESE